MRPIAGKRNLFAVIAHEKWLRWFNFFLKKCIRHVANEQQLHFKSTTGPCFKLQSRGSVLRFVDVETEKSDTCTPMLILYHFDK